MATLPTTTDRAQLTARVKAEARAAGFELVGVSDTR
jgi:hypothetical protein